jgi:hypothetical protein
MTAAMILVVGAACSDASTPSASSTPEAPPVEPGEPYPYEEAPPQEPTLADGIYFRRITLKEAGGRPVACRRCAPYRLDPGRNRLVLQKGRFFARYVPADPSKRCTECAGLQGFEAMGHYVVDGDMIEFFNDVNCIGVHGVYRWEVSESRLQFQVVEDPCAFGELRARFFTRYPWMVER